MYFTLLDLLRFFSSVAVLFHHHFYFYYGYLGIYLFFIISGFVIYFSLQKGIKDYVISRFVRLYPLFWVCCTLTYIVTVLYGVNLPLKNYFISMLMFNDGKIASMVDGSYWTLTFELLFYFYIGAFVWLFGTKKLEWFFVSWLALCFFSFFFAVDQNIIMKLLAFRFVPYFVFGGILAIIIDRFGASGLKTRILLIGTLIASALMPIYVSDKIQVQKDVITNFTGSFASISDLIILESFFIFVPIIVYLSRFAFANTKRFSSICFILGGITYPLYLLHWKIGDILVSQYGKYTEISLWSVSVAILLVVVSYFLATYELPVRKILKTKISNFFGNVFTLKH